MMVDGVAKRLQKRDRWAAVVRCVLEEKPAYEAPLASPRQRADRCTWTGRRDDRRRGLLAVRGGGTGRKRERKITHRAEKEA